MDRAPDSSEKRTYQRFALWFPVTLVVSAPSTEVWSICRDASAGGFLVSSIAPLPVGTALTARFRVTRESLLERFVDAVVVRSETNAGDLMLAFPFSLGLRFAQPIPDLPRELASKLGLDKTQPLL